jgi:hypothetical protein
MRHRLRRQRGVAPSPELAAKSPPRCSSLPPGPPAHNPWSHARRELAPIRADAIRLCRYAYRNSPRGATGDQLVGTALVRGTELGPLVRDFDSLRGAHSKQFTSWTIPAAAPSRSVPDHPNPRATPDGNSHQQVHASKASSPARDQRGDVSVLLPEGGRSL